MDRLSEVLQHFSISAGVFYSGSLCGPASFNVADNSEGHVHLLNSGRLQLLDEDGRKLDFDEPSVLFFPRPADHRLIATEQDQAEILCASVNYGTSARNPLANALPGLIAVRLRDVPALKAIIELLFDEAFQDQNGRAAMMNRLMELFIIGLLRHVMDTGLIKQGMLAGLVHPQLSKAIVAMHRDPEKDWTLERLAELAAMSRSRFAELFREQVGQPAGDYLMEWRVGVAQTYLKQGKPVSWVANKVGYENASALARAFRKKTGRSPRDWLKQQGDLPVA